MTSQKLIVKNSFSKLHQVFFFLLLFLLPTQLGKHFWPTWSFVFGLPVDYLAPTLFLTDLLVLAVLVSWGLVKNRFSFKNLRWSGRLVLLLTFLIANFLASESKPLFIYKLVKVLEFIGLGLYVAKTKPSLAKVTKPLLLAIIYASWLALAQFVKKKTLGGWWWWLGERSFSLGTPGIAKTRLGGKLVLRAYSLFPHPNVLAGFVLVVLILSYRRRLLSKSFFMAAILGLAAILVSFSKLVWLATLVSFCFFVFKQKRQRQLALLVVFLSFLVLALSGRLRIDPYSVSRRWDLARASLAMLKEKPLFGVGLGHFLVKLPFYWQSQEGIRFFQPVHNLFLLVAAEVGLVGLSFFSWFLGKTVSKLWRERRFLVLYALTIIFFLGLFDHYWLTLQQSQLLFSLVFGLAWRGKRS